MSEEEQREALEGLVVSSSSGFYTVETDEGTRVCHLRGRLKKGRRQGDIVAVGDQVIISSTPDAKGMIEGIKPRRRMISRLAPTPRGEYQQIIIANPDQSVFVFACSQPGPRYGMLDRFLVIAEKQNVPALIVANKVDLVGIEAGRELFGHYKSLGYPVLYTSVDQKFGIEELKEKLISKISVLIGPSGVGKSSLLNAIQPGLGLQVKEVSHATQKGRHTTVVRQLFPLEDGGYVADTPGLKALALWDIEPEELDGYFPEMRDLVAQCQFNDCTHLHEPGCAIQVAVENGSIHPERYNSYVKMRIGDDD
jgi:ribosome biogenesis GTPase / thiamine phosphate phosphatase